MKHKHYDMIVAKAENMDLVALIKSKVANRWEVLGSSFMPSFYEASEYFLCLPQHKEACLHWLNGGKVESLHKDYEPMELAESGAIDWGVKSTFMKDSIEIRIKPKKEKRWILECNGTLLTTRIFTNKYAAKLWIDEFDRADEGVSVVEIEVEVTN